MTDLRRIRFEGKVSEDNSTATPLGISGVFTGDWVEILDYGIIFDNVYSDEASATDGLVIEQSSDGVNADHSVSYTVPAGIGQEIPIVPHSQYLRVSYTNGAVAQTEFRLQTLLKGNSKPSSYRLSEDITGEGTAELVTSVLKVPGTDPTIYHNVDSDNPLRVLQPPNDYWKELILGNIAGETTGYPGAENPLVQPGAPENIWWQGGLITWLTADTPLYVSSTNAADNQLVIVGGTDDTYVRTDGIAVLNGQNQVLLDAEFFRVENYFNIGAGVTAGDIYVAESDTLTGGVPDTASKIHLKVPAGQNLATQGTFTIKKDTLGYLCQVRGSVGKGKNAGVSMAGYNPDFALNFEVAPLRTYQGPFSFGDVGGMAVFAEGTTINAIVTTDDVDTPVTIEYRIVEVSIA